MRVGPYSPIGALATAIVISGALVACTDFVEVQASASCGFPPGTALDFGGLASAHELGLGDVPFDPATTVRAYVTRDPVTLADGTRSRAACLELPRDDGVEHWVTPVPDDWEYLPP